MTARVPALLVLLLVALALVAWLEWRPFSGLLRAATSDADGSPTLLGKVLMVGSLAAFLAAIVLSVVEVLRAWRAGRGWRDRRRSGPVLAGRPQLRLARWGSGDVEPADADLAQQLTQQR